MSQQSRGLRQRGGRLGLVARQHGPMAVGGLLLLVAVFSLGLPGADASTADAPTSGELGFREGEGSATGPTWMRRMADGVKGAVASTPHLAQILAIRHGEKPAGGQSAPPPLHPLPSALVAALLVPLAADA
jgi:hypothetical protein